MLKQWYTTHLFTPEHMEEKYEQALQWVKDSEQPCKHNSVAVDWE